MARSSLLPFGMTARISAYLRHPVLLSTVAVLALLQVLATVVWLRTRKAEPPRRAFAASRVVAAHKHDAAASMRDKAAIPPARESGPKESEPLLASISVRSGATAPDTAWSAPACAGSLHLRAILAGRDRTGSVAALATSPSAEAHIVRPGDRFQQSRVWHIGSDRLWLSSGKSLCQVRMFDHAAAEAEPRADQPPARQGPADVLGNGIRQVDDHAFEVDRATLATVLEDPSGLLKGVRALPATTADGRSGFRIAGLRAGSPLARLGLRNGDTIVSVDGHSLADPKVMLEVFARLPRADRAALGIVRDQQAFSLDLTIR